jgi:DNA repair photolyase
MPLLAPSTSPFPVAPCANQPTDTGAGPVDRSDRPMKTEPIAPPSSHSDPVGIWDVPFQVQANNFIHKSLSNWSANISIGCGHGCVFCYVPSASVNKQASRLQRYGVMDPETEWGSYVLLRPFDEAKFRKSLRAAERTAREELNPDGNRAVMFCTTTDPYQVLRHPDTGRSRDLTDQSLNMVRRSLELIRDESSLNVRILTRSPLARVHFNLYRSFGPRLVFGMSLPTLRDDLSRFYEPHAPGPSARLATLKKARDLGLHVYVAMAPTFPECDGADLLETLKAIKDIDPITVFHEPINIRAENVARISERGRAAKIELHTEVFASPQSWRDYALSSLQTVERICSDLGIANRLHSWPDQSLGSRRVVESMQNPTEYLEWLSRKWSRISEWPSSVTV